MVIIQRITRASQAFSCYFQQLGIPSRPFSLPTRVPSDGGKAATDSWPVYYPGGGRRLWEEHPDSAPRGGADKGRIPRTPNQRTGWHCYSRSNTPHPPHGVVSRTSHASG